MVCVLGEDGSLNTQLISLSPNRQLKIKQQAYVCIQTHVFLLMYFIHEEQVGLGGRYNTHWLLHGTCLTLLMTFAMVSLPSLGQAPRTPHLQQRKKSNKR